MIHRIFRQLGQDGFRLPRPHLPFHRPMELIDEADQFLVLVIDLVDAQAELVRPGHEIRYRRPCLRRFSLVLPAGLAYLEDADHVSQLVGHTAQRLRIGAHVVACLEHRLRDTADLADILGDRSRNERSLRHVFIDLGNPRGGLLDV